MKRLLTLWRMSAVRVRLPPAGVRVRILPIRGDFVDVDKSFYLSRRSRMPIKGPEREESR
jgi:hypothetical protein